ncbi:MAG: hypothetical protein NT169_26750 [Chloroflexi bacterium]|nr:hypothetical protein [Chloroflexota bacterium]
MDMDAPSPRSHLFTVRLWLEEFADGGSEWRGKVQHVLSGETRYFRNWHALRVFLQEMSRRSAPVAAAQNPENPLASH